ncbi:MAG: hypothetical protein ACI3Y0_13425, partial [Prevotella sp.]
AKVQKKNQMSKGLIFFCLDLLFIGNHNVAYYKRSLDVTLNEVEGFGNCIKWFEGEGEIAVLQVAYDAFCSLDRFLVRIIVFIEFYPVDCC